MDPFFFINFLTGASDSVSDAPGVVWVRMTVCLMCQVLCKHFKCHKFDPHMILVESNLRQFLYPTQNLEHKKKIVLLLPFISWNCNTKKRENETEKKIYKKTL